MEVFRIVRATDSRFRLNPKPTHPVVFKFKSYGIFFSYVALKQ
jgi:hypothetical protein